MKLLEVLAEAAKKANEAAGIAKLRSEVATVVTELANSLRQLHMIVQLHSTALEQLYEMQLAIALKLKEKSIDVDVPAKIDITTKPN